MQNNCIRWVTELCLGQFRHFYLDAPRKRSTVLRAGRVDCCPQAALTIVRRPRYLLSAGRVICCPQAALSVVRRQRYLLFAGGVGRSISRYTLLVKVAVFKSFRAYHFS